MTNMSGKKLATTPMPAARPLTRRAWSHPSPMPALSSSEVMPLAREDAPSSSLAKKSSKWSWRGFAHSPAAWNSAHSRPRKIRTPATGLRSTRSILSERDSRAGSAGCSRQEASTPSTQLKRRAARSISDSAAVTVVTAAPASEATGLAASGPSDALADAPDATPSAPPARPAPVALPRSSTAAARPSAAASAPPALSSRPGVWPSDFLPLPSEQPHPQPQPASPMRSSRSPRSGRPALARASAAASAEYPGAFGSGAIPLTRGRVTRAVAIICSRTAESRPERGSKAITGMPSLLARALTLTGSPFCSATSAMVTTATAGRPVCATWARR